jgi:hypothetical protein
MEQDFFNKKKLSRYIDGLDGRGSISGRENRFPSSRRKAEA